MARYRVICDIYTPGGAYAFAGSTVGDEGGGDIPIPPGWPPPVGAVDGLTPDAVQRQWDVGPRGLSGAEPNRFLYPWGWFRFSDVKYSPALHYWYSDGHGQFLLRGAEGLGPRGDGDGRVST